MRRNKSAAEDIDIFMFFRDDNGIRAAGEAGVQGYQAAGSSHDLDEEDAAAGFGGIADSIHGLNGSVHGSVKANAHVHTGDIVVDCGGDSDDLAALFLVELKAGPQRALSSNHDEPVEPGRRHLFRSAGASILGLDFRCAGGAEYGSAPLENMGDGFGAKPLKVSVH